MSKGILKYRNPNYVEGGSEPKWITLGSSSGGSTGGSGDTGGDTGGDNGGDGTQYEKVNVSISASNGSSITANVTVNGEMKSVTSGSSVMWEVPYGTEYTIVSDSVDGYSNPESMTFTAEQEIRNVELVYNKIAVSYITINQNITDPATMISGDIKGEAIQMIRDNSHRYLGKYTAENTMTVCQLDDADSNYYSNGSKAYLDGNEGDVFMKLPKFWWKCYEEEEGSNVWTIGFAYGAAPDDTWKCWEGDELIGVFLATVERLNAGLPCIYSWDVEPQAGSSFAENLNGIKGRGNGYSYLKMKHYNMIRLLFLAYYGNTNSQSILGDGVYSLSSANNGMNDSKNEGVSTTASFWGLDRVFTNSSGGKGEAISNAIVNSDSEKVVITEDDGSTRELTTINATVYIKELILGEEGDCLPRSTDTYGSTNTGYCDMAYLGSTWTANNPIVAHSSNDSNAGLFTVAVVNTFYLRITFKGTIIEETDVEAFRFIEITN